MRNYFAIAFTCVYLTLTVGVAKTTHYCMGREKYSSIFSFTAEKCPCSLLAKANLPCCDDRHEILTIKDDQSGGAVLAAPAPDFSEIGLVHTPAAQVAAQPVSFNSAIELSPPPPKVPLFRAFCSPVLYEPVV